MKLKEIREKKGLTQQELADSIGITRQALSMLELSVNNMSVERAKQLAQVLNVNWQLFFEDESN